MNENYLTVKEIAELKSCTERYVRTLIKDKRIESKAVIGQPAGQGGAQYRIPFSSLDNKLQLKYKRKQREAKKAEQPEITQPIEVNEEGLTESERKEITFWKEVIESWRLYRNSAATSKKEADEAYIKIFNTKNTSHSLTQRTLYRKWKVLNAEGAAALLDGRGKHGNHSRKLTSEVWGIFEAFYLDESQKSVQLCMALTELEIKKSGLGLLPLPSADTFAREVNKIPIPHIEYFRHGLKSFIGKCEPYIKRMYENLEPNDIWVADNHTFDIILYDGEKTLRLYLTAFMDVRTRKMMGWCVTGKPCSDATIFALRKGIEKYGIPKMLYTDNGREFLFHDFGGNGFRKKKAKLEGFSQPTILKQLGIGFTTALPRNARAKDIERAFNTVKNTFSKLFEAYTGGNVMEKPDRLKDIAKDTNRLKKVEEFNKFVDTYLSGWYNKQPHSGEGMGGLSPDEAFAGLLSEQRMASAPQLNLMFMRWANPMKVGKNGVTLTFYGKKLQYFSQSLWAGYFGKEVYVRYNPDDLHEVRVYGLDEKFICTAGLKEQLGYSASKEEISRSQKQNCAAVKEVTSYLTNKGIKNHNELELILEKAAENLSEEEKINPGLIRPVFDGEIFKSAVGCEVDEAIDWTTALQNMKRDKGR